MPQPTPSGLFSRKTAENIERLPGQLLSGIGQLAKYLGSEKAAQDYTSLLRGNFPNIGRPASAMAGPEPIAGDPTGRYAPGFMQQSWEAPAAPHLPPPGHGSTKIVQASDDAYRQLLSQYGNLQKEKQYEEAEKIGQEIWQKKYGKTAMAQPGGAVGAFNPLMQSTFGYQKGASVDQPSYAPSASQIQPLGDAAFSVAANAVPAPWNQQGAKVSGEFAGVVPFQVAKTTGEGMPAFQTTGEKAIEFLRDPKFARFFQK